MNDIERLLDGALAGRRVDARPSLADVHRRVRNLRRRNVAVKTSGFLAVGAGAAAMIAVRDPGSTPVGDAPVAVPCDTLAPAEATVPTTTITVPLSSDDLIMETTVETPDTTIEILATTIPIDPTTTVLGVIPALPSSTIVAAPDTGPTGTTTTIAPDGMAPTTTDCVVDAIVPTTTILFSTTVDATVMPDLTGLTSEEVSRVLYDELALNVVANTIVAEGVDAATATRFVVSGQTPAPGTPLVAGQTVEVVFIPTQSSLDTLPPSTRPPTTPPTTLPAP